MLLQELSEADLERDKPLQGKLAKGQGVVQDVQAGGVWQDGPPARWISGRMGLQQDGLRQDGPPEVRRSPEEDEALLGSGHTRIKPRLYLYKLWK